MNARRRNQRRGSSRRHRAAEDHQPEALGPLHVRPDDQRLAQSIRLIKHEDEEGDPGAGNRADDERQHG